MTTSSFLGREAPPCLPGALAVGPQKTGTTWIHEYLARRRDVALPRRVKEVNFFHRYYDRGLAWYAGQFPPGSAFALTVEVAPEYFHEPDVPARVARDLGRIPVVVTLRHPVERLHSLWIHMRRYGMTTQPLREAVRRRPEMLDTSRYADHLRRWRDELGEEHVAVLFLEDLQRDPDGFSRKLCTHLGLDPHPVAVREGRRRVNEAAVPPHPAVAWVGWKTASALRSAGLHQVVERAKSLGLKDVFFGKPGSGEVPRLGPADREWLLELLEPETVKLEHLLGVTLPDWRR